MKTGNDEAANKKAATITRNLSPKQNVRPISRVHRNTCSMYNLPTYSVRDTHIRFIRVFTIK